MESLDEKVIVDNQSSSGQVSEKIDLELKVDIDPEAERRLVRKLDFALLPLFALIYATNYIDRTAVGNAKIAGLEQDLGLHGFQYNIALTSFYVIYVVVEIPSNLALKHFGSIWLAFLIIAFGVVSISTAFIHNFAELVITRMLLGIAEGGLLPGLTYVLSRYYRREELVMRVGIFLGIAPTLAGAFGGLLAFGLLSIDPIGSVQSWRKIFLVEGIITTSIGVICIFIIPADPEHTTRFLTEAERALALQRIAADRITKNSKREKTTLKLVLRAFNFSSVICGISYFLIDISFQGLSLFMPTVIATLGNFTVVESQLKTVPPYIVACIWSVVNSYISLRTRNRGFNIFGSVLLSVVGYAIFVSSKNSHARYGACFLAISGGSPAGPMLVTWATDNAAPETVRAVTTAIIPAIGTLGAVVGIWAYSPNDAPDYHRGNSINLGAVSMVCVLALVAMWYMGRENKKRDNGERDHRLLEKSQEEIEQLGSRHPAYRYQL